MILIAEDELLNRMLLERYVEKINRTCTCVENGEELLRVANAQKFSLLIIDVSMPLVDGIEAITEIRKQKGINQNTPIILLSGTYPANFNELKVEYAISHIIIKPYTFNDVKNAIEKFVE